MPLAIQFHKEKVNCFLNDINIYFSALDLPGAVSLPCKWLFILLCALHCAWDDSVNQLKVKRLLFVLKPNVFFNMLRTSLLCGIGTHFPSMTTLTSAVTPEGLWTSFWETGAPTTPYVGISYCKPLKPLCGETGFQGDQEIKPLRSIFVSVVGVLGLSARVKHKHLVVFGQSRVSW